MASMHVSPARCNTGKCSSGVEEGLKAGLAFLSEGLVRPHLKDPICVSARPCLHPMVDWNEDGVGMGEQF